MTLTDRDHDYRVGEDAGLRGLPLPSEGYTDPLSAHEHRQRVRGYEEGERLRNSPEFRAGYERGKADLAAGGPDAPHALQNAMLLSAAHCAGEMGLEEQGHFYAVFGGELA